MSGVRRIGLTLLAPVMAIVVAAIVTTLVLVIAGEDAGLFWETLATPPAARNIVNIINNASVLYLSGLAAAIGFRMNLFNIGVEGQYRVATFCAAVFAAQAWLPGYANTVATLLVAMAAGAAWAGIAGALRVYRGVSEVISTIMLNAIAVSLTAYFLRQAGSRQGQSIQTDEIPEGSRIGGIPLLPDSQTDVYGLVVLAVAMGVLFWFVINRTVFGFNLRATGMSESAAVASGVNVKRMVLVSMLLSGAVAGLIGMPNLFGVSYNYGSTIQTGIGFAGIAVALLGRNHPVGVAIGALVFAFLNEQSSPLGILAGISPDIILITQGAVVLSVVIAYAVVERYGQRLEQGAVADALAAERKQEGAAA
jgi:general nucleoside transport system permease protein